MTKLFTVVLAAFAASIASMSPAAHEQRTHVPRAVRLAANLAREPAAIAGFVAAVPSDRAWAEAERRAPRIPLPRGGNFNGIQWTTQPRLSTAQIEQILEYNAFCQWLRTRRGGHERGVAQQVLSTVPSWPAMRAHPGVVRAVVTRRKPELAAAVLADCERAHRREIEVASRAGLVPPR